MGNRAAAMYKGLDQSPKWSDRFQAEWSNFFRLLTGEAAKTNELLGNIEAQGAGNRSRALEADAMNHPR